MLKKKGVNALFSIPCPALRCAQWAYCYCRILNFSGKINYAAVASDPEEDAHRRGDKFSAASTVIVP